jgi:CRP-like cAMP-binding protein
VFRAAHPTGGRAPDVARKHLPLLLHREEELTMNDPSAVKTSYTSSGVSEGSSSASDLNASLGVVKDLAGPLTYPASVELFHQGSPPQDVYLIERGLVKLIRLERGGHEIITSLRFAGWLLGASPVIVEKPYPVTALTVTRCSLRRVPAEIFREHLRANPQLSWYLHQMHSHEVFDNVEHVAQLGCLSARLRFERLLRQLLASAAPAAAPHEIRLRIPLKHWEVAELIAVTPEHLSRMLRKMEAEGLLRREKGWLIITGLGWLSASDTPLPNSRAAHPHP